MSAWMRRLIAAIIAACVAVGLLGVGLRYAWWGPEPPGDPDTVVLRIRYEGGLTPYSLSASRMRPVPDISVYGDGRVLVTAYDLARSSAREVVRDQRLTRTAYRRVYRDARLAGLAQSRTFHSEKQIPDGVGTEVTLLVDGRQHVSTVESGADGVRVRAIESLAKRLRSVRGGDLTGPPAIYRPARVAVVAWRPVESTSDSAFPATPWPLRRLTTGPAATCTLLTGADADAAVRLADSVPSSTRWRSGRDVFAVFFRPLLPDEADCAAVTRRAR